MQENADDKVIIIEPFYGGSHKALIDTLVENFQDKNINFSLITLPSKKWHWRARCAAIQIYDKIPKIVNQKTLFASSVLNLAELLGLRPDLINLTKIVYFHENQLVYPVQQIKSRDVQYAYNQIITCLAADVVLFNSAFNMNSFLNNIEKILKLLPDHRPKLVKTDIVKKCSVLYFPVSYPVISLKEKSRTILHIVWPHRWEFDKGPIDFFDVLFKLKKDNVQFKLSVLGELYHIVPEVFEKAKKELLNEIIEFGFVDSKTNYFNILCSNHVVVSTAKHEFFGVSVLEAAYCGCFPLVPNALVYPEIYPAECLYSDGDDLYKKLKRLCLDPSISKTLRKSCKIDFNKYSDKELIPQYLDVLKV